MGASDRLQASVLPDYLMPALGADGAWGTVGGAALRQSLNAGFDRGVVDLFRSMNAGGVASVLRETGFVVEPGSAALGRAAVLASVQDQLTEALDARVDGFALRMRGQSVVLNQHDGELAFDPLVFDGDVTAARVIQGVLRSDHVTVELLGDAAASERSALLLVAGQGLLKGIQGFGFDGIDGKYQVPLAMAGVVDLHRDAASSVAVESVRTGLASWVAGSKLGQLSDWVPDSVQRVLTGSVSLAAAQAVVNAIEGGSIARHAGEIGTHKVVGLLAAQGLDVNAPTIEQRAIELGLAMKEPDRQRGQYFGQVFAVDHRAALVKVTRSEGMALPFAALPAGERRPGMGDALRMGYKAGVLTVSVAERVRHAETER